MNKKAILIVEDEPVYTSELAALLEKLGYAVTGIAADGKEARRMASETPPDAVLMDIELSGKMGGADAVSELFGRYGAPVIYLTEHTDADMLDISGMRPYGIFMKPIRDIDLVSAVETAIQRHSLESRFRNMKEPEKLDSELRRIRRFESIQELIGGLAHDFSNMLTAVLGNLSLARMRQNDSSDAGRYFEKAERAIALARERTRKLIVFARGDEPIKKPVDIGGLVREVALTSRRGGDIVHEFDIPPNLAEVPADRRHIRVVIENLILNAEEAIPIGGKVFLRARRAEVAPDSDLPVRPGPYIVLSVEDTGAGIRETDRERIFDPYFSTKKKGGGLGLPIAYSIVRKHDGIIILDSREGKGTSFHVYLPLNKAGDRPEEL